MKQHCSETYRVFDIIRASGKPDQEVMWQSIEVSHTGATRRTFYKRPDLADYPNGDSVLIDRDIIRRV